MLRRAIWGSLALGLMVAVFCEVSYAIPVFARKYRTSCNTCHVAVPKLTGFGEAFRLNGYQIPEGDAGYIKDEPVSLGASAWSRVWPDTVWPGEIPGLPPISVRIMSDFKVHDRANAASTQFDFPHEVEVFMAGTLGENIPFFAEIEFEEGASETEAWLGFYSLLDHVLPERSLNLKVGSLMLNPLSMANDHLRLGANHYLYGDWRVQESANDFRLRGARPGFELNGIVASRFWYGAGIVQGDETHDKDFYTIGRYKYGGTPFDKSAGEGAGVDEAVTGKSSGFWVDNSIELTAFGYFGETEVTGGVDDEFTRVGLGLRGQYQNLDLFGGFVWGENDDPHGTDSAQGIDSQTWFIEGNYVIFPWLIGSLRYEALAVDEATDYVVGARTDMDRSRWVPALVLQIRPNIKVVAEGLIYDRYDAGADDPDDFTARLDFSF